MRREIIAGQRYRVFYDDHEAMEQREILAVFVGRTDKGYYEFDHDGQRITLMNPVIRLLADQPTPWEQLSDKEKKQLADGAKEDHSDRPWYDR